MPSRIAVASLSLTVLVVVGVAWLFLAYHTSDSYEYGYAGAFVPANSEWWVLMPPDSACDELAAAGIRRDGALNYAEIVEGCQSGFYDAVTDTRERLGYSPLP
jgi:hypothetical protein